MTPQMRIRSSLHRTARSLVLLAAKATAVLLLSAAPWQARAETGEKLPWEADYASALAKAKTEKRPLFVMLTATWCGPCKALESKTLTDPAIRSGLKEFVWVQAYEDKALDKKFDSGGYPTLVFLDVDKEQVVARSTGYEPANSFLTHVIEARKGAGLPLTDEMKKISALAFEPDGKKVEALTKSGDLDGLAKYLAPIEQDQMRSQNYVLVKVHAPEGIGRTEVAGMIGSRELNLSEGWLAIGGVRLENPEEELKIMAPGCKVVSERLRFEDGKAVIAREIQLEGLATQDAASFSGRVLLPDGKPAANAIVRIVDSTKTKTDGEGRFHLEGISPGDFLVRGESPGGEFHQELTFAAGKELNKDLPLTAVTTVGIRWAVQTTEGSRKLVGDGVRTGEAYFSLEHSRFVLERGAQSRMTWGSDFMLMDWNGGEHTREFTDPSIAKEADAAEPGTPIFWLYDATDRATGLHREAARFEDLTEIAATTPSDGTRYFQFLRGNPVRKGDVFTIWCVRRDCYAKMEITDVTVVPK
jgi:thiol-disulfide isomerase/thioredoxin